MMQKFGFAAVAHSAGNWYWTNPSESLTGDCEKAGATVTDVAVLAVIPRRSSVVPNLRMASSPTSAPAANMLATRGIVLLLAGTTVVSICSRTALAGVLLPEGPDVVAHLVQMGQHLELDVRHQVQGLAGLTELPPRPVAGVAGGVQDDLGGVEADGVVADEDPAVLQLPLAGVEEELGRLREAAAPLGHVRRGHREVGDDDEVEAAVLEATHAHGRRSSFPKLDSR